MIGFFKKRKNKEQLSIEQSPAENKYESETDELIDRAYHSILFQSNTELIKGIIEELVDTIYDSAYHEGYKKGYDDGTKRDQYLPDWY